MGRRTVVVALAALATAFACTSEPGPAPTPVPTSPPASSPSPDPDPSPVPVSPVGVPVPATPPAGIVATTASGEVVVIELPTLAATTIARYPPVEPKGEVQTFFVSAITVTPEERILLSTCCEPAAGAVRTLNFNGREAKSPPDFGDDPELDPTGRLVVRGDIDGLSISPVERRRIGKPFSLSGKSGHFAADPAWSPDSERIAYTLQGRLYVIDATATTTRGLDPIRGKRGTYWGPIAWTSTGLLVAEIAGRWDDQGPSRIVRVDPASGTKTELWRSGATITDLATSRQPNAYLWVAGGTLHWSLGGTTASLEGDYVKAAFFPG